MFAKIKPDTSVLRILFQACMMLSIMLFMDGCKHGRILRRESVETIVRSDIQNYANAILLRDVDAISGNLSPGFQSTQVVDMGLHSITSVYAKAEYIESYERAFSEAEDISFAYSNLTIQVNEGTDECVASFDYQLLYKRPPGAWSDTIGLYGVRTNICRIAGNKITLSRSMANHIQVQIIYEHPAAKTAFSVLRYRKELRNTYDGMTRTEIINELPQEHYLLVEADTDIPDGWPQTIRHMGEDENTRDGNRRLIISWFMTADGDEWFPFYSYCLSTYRSEFREEPAAIFERRSVNGHNVVLPVIHFCFDESGMVTRSSQERSYVTRMRAFHHYVDQMNRKSQSLSITNTPTIPNEPVRNEQ